MKRYLAVADLETVATNANAGILTIGIAAFDLDHPFDAPKTIYIALHGDDQSNRDVDSGTMEWWGQQDQRAYEAAFEGDNQIGMDEAADKIINFLQPFGDEFTIWGHGPTFDVDILEDMFAEVERPVPWSFRDIRDIRTARDLLGFDITFEGDEFPHHALHDATAEGRSLVQAVFKSGVRSTGWRP
jgi:hypothetical protein